MLRALAFVNVVLVLVLAGYLVVSAPAMRQQAKDGKVAIAQAKQGARFTADDGRQLCLAVATAHPEVIPMLPSVCLLGISSAP